MGYVLLKLQVITEDLGMNLDKFEPSMFGSCKKVAKFTLLIVKSSSGVLHSVILLSSGL
jgi:hypothetical protein